MFYSFDEISVMAKGHESDLLYMRKCCSRSKTRSRNKNTKIRLSRLVSALMLFFKS